MEPPTSDYCYHFDDVSMQPAPRELSRHEKYQAIASSVAKYVRLFAFILWSAACAMHRVSCSAACIVHGVSCTVYEPSVVLMGDCCDCLAAVLRLGCTHGNSLADLLEAVGARLHGRPATHHHRDPAPRVAPAPTPPRERNDDRRVIEEIVIDESTISNITSEDCVSEDSDSDTESEAFRRRPKVTRNAIVQVTPRTAAARKSIVPAKVSTAKKERGLERIKALRERRRRHGLKVC